MMRFFAGLITGLLALIPLTALAAIIATRRLRRSLTQAQQTAQHAERLAELGTLTGGLAHEIKNPLSTIGLNLQLLAEDLNPTSPGYDRLQHRLSTVLRETNRLRDILEDFLRYAGKLELDLRPVDLNTLLEEMVDFFSPQAQIHRVQIRLQPTPVPLIVRADAKILKQAILNLMLNAVQAMPDGGELILSDSQIEGKARLSVIDTGPGMSPDVLNRIFDAYYSTKKGGTGLGLAMARRIIHEHGGQLSVRSEVGKGSDFSITLPLARDV